ncbi:short chain dehydrogenase (plasmid) [Ketogulonicigenium vulgare Y25]|uniref:Short-chain dehydrogenase of various substrate specificities n=1 Tax=Ketogulonicigenium vulgare (strain WSH-001) TaxID=759362 RepID=F9YBY8_KETVW|nr:SDR family oxidoreductase [Ketogulonicigenium vulgare]ADO44238.1 short chain dehydrogenase [Ketogulonicigenium vulgare Y25]AEM42890.1 Short-chain dehydrogenase of various substrate specificities [Ketogulonicigenium vulgare WSH-001]ALJ82685.1 AraC family transcriptional regulator [Ketogulonicigenium vulgare]
MNMSLPKVLITGASSGIGATYADRFAHRGHDLVLVARSAGKLADLAARLRAEAGVAVEVLVADLAVPEGQIAVEAKLRQDAQIGILVNNAGASIAGAFTDQDIDVATDLVNLNTISLMRLTHAILPRLKAAGQGAVINIGSVVGMSPEFGMAVYGATKGFVLSFSQALQVSLQGSGVYVQAVLPAATRTDIWAGADPAHLPPMMAVDDLVDAALAGFDAREAVSIPHLHDLDRWTAFEGARIALLQDVGNITPAPRYAAAD